ncbi:hypothetical protein HDV05_008274, partial [Chytridiales sp. JEL 0842]
MNDTITYNLRSPDGSQLIALTVPWAVLPSSAEIAPNLNREAFYTTFCQPSNTVYENPIYHPSAPVLGTSSRPLPKKEPAGGKVLDTTEINWTVLEPPPSSTDLRANLGAHLHNIYGGQLPPSSTSLPVLSDGPGGVSFFLLENKVGVWMMGRMGPWEDTPAAWAKWVESNLRGLKRLEYLGVQRILVDVSGNFGAGSEGANAKVECVIRGLVKFLAKGAKGGNGFAYAMRASQGLQAFASNITEPFLFDVNQVTPVNGSKFTTPQDLLQNNLEFQSTIYTPLFTLSACDSIISTILSPTTFNQLNTPWTADNLVVLSNGLCSGHCASFLRSLRDELGVRVFTYGPSGSQYGSSRTEATTGVQGLIVDTSADTLQAGVFPFVLSAPLWASFNSDKGPLDWIPDNSDVHVRVSDPSDPAGVWTKVVERAFGGYVVRATVEERETVLEEGFLEEDEQVVGGGGEGGVKGLKAQGAYSYKKKKKYGSGTRYYYDDNAGVRVDGLGGIAVGLVMALIAFS